MEELNLMPSGAARSSAHGASMVGGALRDADFWGCRWIEGDPTPVRRGMFCGSPVAPGLSWCTAHRGVVFEEIAGRGSPAASTALRRSENFPKPAP